MNVPPGATSVTAGAELVERALGFTRGALGLVTPAALSSPTPCAAWLLGDLLAHMLDSMVALREAAAGSVPLSPWVGENTCADDLPKELAVVASLRDHGCSLLGAWSRLDHDRPVAVGGGALPASTVARAGALEIAVHGWDVARACGRPWSLPDQLANDLLGHAAALVARQDRGVRFARPVPLPPGSPASDRLIAFTGRAPDWGP